MPFIEVQQDVRLHVVDLGEGPVVVLIPGFGMTTMAWDRQIRVLTDKGFRVVALDMRGHGQSDKPLAGYEMDRLADDVLGVLDTRRIESCALVGWSFGGQVAFRLAAKAPQRVSRLVLVGSNAVRASRSADFPFGREPGPMLEVVLAAEDADRLAARRSTIRNGFAAEPDAATLEWMTQQSLLLPSWAAVACYRTMLETDLSDDLTRVSMPVLQIAGSQDPIHSATGSRWLNERLRDAVLVELPGCGHYPMVEAADAFDQALADFLSQSRRA